MEKNTKRIYTTPHIKVVAFNVEEGFAGSPTGDTSPFNEAGLFNIFSSPVGMGNESLTFGGDLTDGKTPTGGSLDETFGSGSWF